MKTNPLVVVFAAAVALVICGVAGFMFLEKYGPPSTRMGFFTALESENDVRFRNAREAVARLLKAPSTAKFCPVHEARFLKKDGDDAVELWVDAQNMFGVPIRSHWGITLEPGTHRVKEVVNFEQEMERLQAEHEEKMRRLEQSTQDIVSRLRRP